MNKFLLKYCEILIKFRDIISIRTNLPRNKSRFYYKRTLQKFRNLFQMDFEFTIHPPYVRVFQIKFLLHHAYCVFLRIINCFFNYLDHYCDRFIPNYY